ncbi:hypothetical protein I316_07516, partial [Kwoniella heveanensis BCC8398]
RTLKTRCDGQQPCDNCLSRKRDCKYLPSRRGGARVKKNVRTISHHTGLDGKHQRECLVPNRPLELPIESFITPGAGLRHVPDAFEQGSLVLDEMSFSRLLSSLESQVSSQVTPLVRMCPSNQAILEAYYIYVHPFFPILPPPRSTPADLTVSSTDNSVPPFKPSSPLALAIAAVIALIPCAEEGDYQSVQSVMSRRKFSQYLARSAVEIIENDASDAVDPSDALAAAERDCGSRFHPEVPQEYEEVIALNLLSFYEYAQMGNLKKSKARSGQALVAALDLDLHACPEDDIDIEVKARVWWMTYIAATQAAIVSNTVPNPMLFASTVTTRNPTLRSDVLAYGAFIDAQRLLLRCTRFAGELVSAVRANADLSHLGSQMIEMDGQVERALTVAESQILQGETSTPLDLNEQVVSRALWCMSRIKLNSARIKIHRYCAFTDDPLFSGKYCDLNPRSVTQLSSTPDQSQSADKSILELLSTTIDLFPFTRDQSSTTCLTCAFSIAQTFNDLPLPNPVGQWAAEPSHLASFLSILAPRMVPSLACCAMQCTYVLAKVIERIQPTVSNADHQPVNPAIESFVTRLKLGLRSISVVFDNYALAFEALGGMRGMF